MNSLPQIAQPITSINRTRGLYTAKLADGSTAPLSTNQAKRLLKTAPVAQHWSFGCYANWILEAAKC